MGQCEQILFAQTSDSASPAMNVATVSIWW